MLEPKYRIGDRFKEKESDYDVDFLDVVGVSDEQGNSKFDTTNTSKSYWWYFIKRYHNGYHNKGMMSYAIVYENYLTNDCIKIK